MVYYFNTAFYLVCGLGYTPQHCAGVARGVKLVVWIKEKIRMITSGFQSLCGCIPNPSICIDTDVCFRMWPVLDHLTSFCNHFCLSGCCFKVLILLLVPFLSSWPIFFKKFIGIYLSHLVWRVVTGCGEGEGGGRWGCLVLADIIKSSITFSL